MPLHIELGTTWATSPLKCTYCPASIETGEEFHFQGVPPIKPRPFGINEFAVVCNSCASNLYHQARRFSIPVVKISLPGKVRAESIKEGTVGG
jgi:hypothetical protein